MQRVVADYLHRVDADAPGVVEGLYLTGSIALGDFRARLSDLDFVAVTSEAPSDHIVARLARVHRRVARSVPRPRMDGVYVARGDLPRPPRAPGLTVTGPRIRSEHVGDPVTWMNLAACSVPVWGDEPTSLGVRVEPAEARAWSLRNARTYWAAWLASAHRPGRLALWTLDRAE